MPVYALEGRGDRFSFELSKEGLHLAVRKGYRDLLQAQAMAARNS